MRAKPPWWGGDLQTLRNRLIGKEVSVPGPATPFEAATSDGTGDRLTGTLHGEGRRVVVLVHGLTGSEDSTYVRVAAKHLTGEGFTVLRLNLRGAGSSAALCRFSYSGASWPDVVDAVRALEAEAVLLVGFSLGGNVLANLAARLPDDLAVAGVATVSAPIEPAQAADRMMQRRNAIYSNALLKEMREAYRRLELTPAEARAVEEAHSIRAFDDAITAPRFGFAGAAEYYEATAAARVIDQASVPLLLIHAEDDPWIPADPYRPLAEAPPPGVTVELTPTGGHVGFHIKGFDLPWHDVRIARFAAETLG